MYAADTKCKPLPASHQGHKEEASLPGRCSVSSTVLKDSCSPNSLPISLADWGLQILNILSNLKIVKQEKKMILMLPGSPVGPHSH